MSHLRKLLYKSVVMIFTINFTVATESHTSLERLIALIAHRFMTYFVLPNWKLGLKYWDVQCNY